MKRDIAVEAVRRRILTVDDSVLEREVVSVRQRCRDSQKHVTLNVPPLAGERLFNVGV